MSVLAPSVHTLILEEQERQHGAFISGVDLDAYLAKLGARAEFLADFGDGRCRGFVAYYCNDRTTRQAYITLVLVDPRDRGHGLGRTLVAGVLSLAGQRGFSSCRLEVATSNHAARDLYTSLGFTLVQDREGKSLLEVQL